MARVIVADDRGPVAELIIDRLRQSPSVELCRRGPPAGGIDGLDGLASLIENQKIDTVVYFPPPRPGSSELPDLGHADVVFRHCARAPVKSVILLASAAAYEGTYSNPGFISESRPLKKRSKNLVAAEYAGLERIARTCFGNRPGITLTILRPVPMPVRGGADYFSRLLAARFAIVFPGHDPSLQILSPVDLAGAVRCAVEKKRGGVYNVAPDTVIPLRHALRLVGATRIPAPHWLQRLARRALGPAGLARSIDQVEYIRYSFTVSNEKIKRELGFVPARSSAEALLELMPERRDRPEPGKIAARDYDPFGMDKDYIAAYGRTLFKFLERYYWRIEVAGLASVPREGRAVLAGVHRGFMPWDGVMALHLIVQRTGRYPRFLVHPGLLKFPFIFDFIRKLGGVIACRENADYLLQRDQIVGMFPEGVQGAFSLYRDAYRLGKFGRDEFVKMALRSGAPIVPFITVGSAEVFPILKKIEWRRWKRYTEWPCLPITPTFPLLPLPLPSKWHTQFLAPIQVQDRYPPEAAGNAETVRAISQEVRARLEQAMNEMLSRRRSVFYGSVFERGSK